MVVKPTHASFIAKRAKLVRLPEALLARHWQLKCIIMLCAVSEPEGVNSVIVCWGRGDFRIALQLIRNGKLCATK